MQFVNRCRGCGTSQPGVHRSTLQQQFVLVGPLSSVTAAQTATTAHSTAIPAQQHVAGEHATPVTTDTPSPRRRRRATTRSNENASRKPAATPRKGSRNPRVPAYELFQHQFASVVAPATNEVALPAAALSDPSEALRPRTRRLRHSGAPGTEQRPQPPAEFEPFAQSFQQVAQQLAAKQQQGGRTADPQASAAAQAEAAWRSSSNSEQRDSKQHKGSKQRSTGKMLELFGVDSDSSTAYGTAAPLSTAMTARKVDAQTPDTLAQQPSQSRLAAQRLANLLMQQQQQRKLQHQQQEAVLQDQQQQEVEQQGSSTQQPARIIPPSVPQQGATRLYMPAPSVNEAASAADRQPLRLLSIRQQQQMRQEARQQAIQKLRQKAVQDYQATLDQTLNWQGSGQYTYHPATPRFLPVALQSSWIPSSSSSGSGSKDQPTAAANEPSAATAGPVQLSGSDLAAVKAIDQVVTRQLGSPAALPDRAYKGERGLYIASLSPQAIADRLKRWISCCGPEYAAQLIKREPCLLGLEPQALLKTLEALNKVLQLSTQACVEFVSKNVVIVGLDSDELRARIQGLRDAIGLGWDDAVELVQKQPQLLMVHPSHTKGQMSALAQLLPEAAPKLPQAVKRSPFLILKSPRAIARSIQELADSLGLSTWATARLVAGQPSILNSNFDQLQRRLERLQTLTSVSKRWQRELQALSPALLARCLVCSDATIDRLALLTDVGAAGSSRLPAINRILTLPEDYFHNLLADMAERQLRRQHRLDAAEDEGSAGETEFNSHQLVAVTAGVVGGGSSRNRAGGSAVKRTSADGDCSNASTAQTAVGRRLLQRLGLAGTEQTGSSIGLATAVAARDAAQTGHHDGTDAVDDGDSISDKAVREGVLGGDIAWRSTLAGLKDALQQSVADLAGSKKTAAASRKPSRAS